MALQAAGMVESKHVRTALHLSHHAEWVTLGLGCAGTSPGGLPGQALGLRTRHKAKQEGKSTADKLSLKTKNL